VKIFQVFNLNLGEIGKLKTKELLKLNFPRAGENLIKQLWERGYEVFVDFDRYGGLPTSIIVATEMSSGRNAKSDFYEIVGKLGIKYFSSGKVYTQAALSS
jgi:hypothetical protein